MSLPKLLALVAILLFSTIGIVAIFKGDSAPPVVSAPVQVPIEIELDQKIQTVVPALAAHPPVGLSDQGQLVASVDLPDANRIEELFDIKGSKLPIVETVTYKSRVSWQKGRPAWLSDYAGHYHTSRHFIARSLNGKPDYLKQELAEGDQFNVLRADKNFEFYLIVDTSRCHMWFYYIDLDANQKQLLKTYPVGLGRLDSSRTSGLLTPMGKYTLGSRVAIFKPTTMGIHAGEVVKLMSVFGTRWIPFEKEVGNCTLPAKGFGIHGTPWKYEEQGELIDDRGGLGKYESDGCIRLATPDMEELFAIIITKPTTIEIVRDFSESSLAGMDP